MGKKKIKKQSEEINMKKPEERYPVFCFKHLQQYSYHKCEDAEFFIEFLERMNKLANLGWQQIEKSHRHGYGLEKIPVNQLKPAKLPSIVTEEVKAY